ncbi:alpha/beta fold hydrolase [Paractinoplanes lichenicola]|uniref:Alpha/beta hydrolase n=1 Tax=Paractinoplanes lichenicola TaxID=2802976 RepID=A0ABS1VL08_9ACTN|nr:alpha/beta hydrolase [Actinoplanes lichenicola]MBL7255399.1 alpha/beta hydrolase [Actinoplanes lichenicola]
MTFLPALLWSLPAAAWGAVAGWWTPRGPLTITQALCSVAVSAAIGWAAGRFGRSRLMWLVVPVAFLFALELVRAGVAGPSTGPPHGSPFGVVVLLAGRGVQAVLTLLPLLLGVWAGRGVRRRVLYALPAAALLLFTAAVAVPARTAGISGGVAELARVGRLGVMIRGAHADAPVLLFVPGAPGGSELGNVRTHLAAVEQRFVMATLDRRGGGSSYPALDPASRVTVDRLVDDILEVTDYLRERFGQDQIFLYGHSGGSLLSVLAVQRHPEKFRAYIGSGQAVNLPASDRIFYDDILAWARAGGRDEVVRRLTGQGPPPYGEVWAYEPIMLHENEAYDQRPLEFGLGVREFTLLQKIHVLNAMLDTWEVSYPRMQQIDLRRDASSLRVPAWFVMGADEMRGLQVLFDEWYAQLRAPTKKLVVVPGAGHAVMFEQPERFLQVLDDVLAG